MHFAISGAHLLVEKVSYITLLCMLRSSIILLCMTKTQTRSAKLTFAEKLYCFMGFSLRKVVSGIYSRFHESLSVGTSFFYSKIKST